MTIFVDTSALFAVIDRNDKHHSQAGTAWKRLIEQNATLVCTSYVLVETVSLLQSRLGLEGVTRFVENVVPMLTVEWVSGDVHHASLAALLTAARRDLSLVDCTSFEVMRRRGIVSAFAFDGHFQEQGFVDVSR